MKDIAVSLRYNYAHTVNIARFVDRNDALLGSPWSTGLGAGGTNGVSSLTTVESTANSVYNGITLGLVKRYTNNFEFQAFYTLSWDKSDDDNERDPFTLQLREGHGPRRRVRVLGPRPAPPFQRATSSGRPPSEST